MDAEDRSTLVLTGADVVRRDLAAFCIPGAGALPFCSHALLAQALLAQFDRE